MDLDVCKELAGALNESSSREQRAEIVAEFMARYKAGRTTVYRWARKGGHVSGRAGVGGKKAKPLPIDKLEQCAKIIHAATSKKYGANMPTARAIRVGIQSGFWKEGELKPGMVNKYLRENCPRNAQSIEPPHIPRKTDYVLQVCQADTSVCAQFYLKPDATVGTQDPKIYANKNKGSKGLPIQRFVWTEVTTGAFYVEYFTGHESTEKLVPAVWRAMMPKWDEEKYPLKGMPDILLTDKGSGLDNGYCETLFENLSIEFRTHAKGNPRAKGSVEQAMYGIIETQIETLLHLEPATSIAELNRKIRPLVIELNGVNKHSRYAFSRSLAFASWVRTENLRLPPRELDHFLSLAYREEGRTIDGALSFSFKGSRYSFLADDSYHQDPAIQALKGQKVTVMYSPFDKGRVKVVTKDGKVYSPARVEKDKFGYAAHAVSMKSPGLAPKMAKHPHIENIEKLADVELPGPVKAFANDDLLKNVGFIVRPAREFEGTPIEEIMSIPRLEAKKKLQERLDRRLEKSESAWLNESWAEMVSEDEIEAAFEKLSALAGDALRGDSPIRQGQPPTEEAAAIA